MSNTRRRGKKSLALLLTAALLLTMLPLAAIPAWAAEGDETGEKDIFAEMGFKTSNLTDQAARQDDDGAFGAKEAYINVPSEIFITSGMHSSDTTAWGDLYFHNKPVDNGRISNTSSYDAKSSNGWFPAFSSESKNNGARNKASRQMELSLNAGSSKKNLVATLTVSSHNAALYSDTANTLNYRVTVIDPVSRALFTSGAQSEWSGTIAATQTADGTGYSACSLFENAIYMDTGDLNGDGIDEIIVAYLDDTGVSDKHVLKMDVLSYSGGGFQRKGAVTVFETSHTAQNLLASLAVGDLNGDGLDDIAIAASGVRHPNSNYNNATVKTPQNKSTVVSIFSGTASGLYGAANTSAVQVGSLFGTGLAIVDVNNDGREDLLLGGTHVTKQGASTTPGSGVDFTAINGHVDGLRIVTAYTMNYGGAMTQMFRSDAAGAQPADWYNVRDGKQGAFSTASSVTAFYYDGRYDEEGKTKMPYLFMDSFVLRYDEAAQQGWVLDRWLEGSDAGTHGTPKDSAFANNLFSRESKAFDARGVNLNDPEGRESLVVKVRTGSEYRQAVQIMAPGANFAMDIVCGLDGAAKYHTPLSFACPDTDEDAARLVLKEKAVMFADPVIVTALVAPPYFKDLEHHSDGSAGNFFDNTSISYSQSSSETDGSSKSYGVEAGVYFGFEQDITVLGFKVASFEFEASVMAGFTQTFENARTVTSGYSFSAKPGDDRVIMSAVPYDVFLYDFYAPVTDGSGGYKAPVDYEVNIPYDPQFVNITVETYDAFRAIYNDELPDGMNAMPDLKTDVFSHKYGEPNSYLPASKLQEKTGNMQTVHWDSTKPFSVEAGSGGSSAFLEIEESTTNHKAYTQSVSFKIGGGPGSIKAGVQSTNTFGQNTIKTIADTTAYSLTVEGVPREFGNKYQMKYQLFYYFYGITGDYVFPANTAPAEQSPQMIFPVVTSVVTSVEQPPMLPSAESLALTEKTASSLTIGWDASTDPHVTAYEVYTVDSGGNPSQNPAKTIPAMVGQKEYTYTASGLKSQTEFHYAIRAISGSAASAFSKTISGTTMDPNMGDVTIALTGAFTPTDGDPVPMDADRIVWLDDSSTGAVTLTANVTQAAQAYQTKAEWEWTKPDGTVAKDDSGHGDFRENPVITKSIAITNPIDGVYGQYRLVYTQKDTSQSAEAVSYSDYVEIRQPQPAASALELGLPDELTVAVPAAAEDSAVIRPVVSVYDANEALILPAPAVTWAFTPTEALTGIAYDSATGAITVGSTAEAQSITVTATVTGTDVTKSATVTVAKPNTVASVTAALTDDAVELPGEEEYTITALDAYGDTTTYSTIDWQLRSGNGVDNPYAYTPLPTGVRFDDNSKKITVAATAAPATLTLVAVCDGVRSNPVTLTISRPTPVATKVQLFNDFSMTRAATAEYSSTLNPGDIVSFSFYAKAVDQFGDGMDETIKWSVTESPNVSAVQMMGERAEFLISHAAEGAPEVTLTATIGETQIYASLAINVTYTTAAALSTPTGLSWNEQTATWTAVANASSYQLILYRDGVAQGDPRTTSTSSYDFSGDLPGLGTGDYTFAVRALGTGNTTSDYSEPSSALAYTALVKSVSVGTQSGELTAGTAGTVTYTVTTANIADGSYVAVVSPLPTGATAESVAIASDTGTLTIATNAATPAGTYPLTLTIDETRSLSFDLTIGEASAVASATVANVTISGVIGTALDGQTATITLADETLAAALSSVDAAGWFTGLPAGLSVTASGTAGADTITLTFGGEPSAISAAAFAITIPGAALASEAALTVAANPNAKFAIAAADDTLVTAAAIGGATAPVAGETPSTAISNGTGFTSALSWIGSPSTFGFDTQYTATITLTAASGYTFSGGFGDTAAIAGFTVGSIAPVWVSNGGSTLVFTVTFPKTEAAPGDTQKPTVTSVTPTGTAAELSGSIVITFSEEIDGSFPSTVSIPGATITGGIWDDSKTVYTASYSGLDYETVATITISGFADAAGNVMVEDGTHSFTTKANPALPYVSPQTLDITTGDTASFTVSLGSSNATSATVVSENPAIATVSTATTSGGEVTVTGVSEGNTSITVTFDDTANTVKTVSVKVTDPAPTTYSLSVSAGPGGSVSGSQSDDYAVGDLITVTATAKADYSFTGWTASGVEVPDTASISFDMPENNVTLTANFRYEGGGGGGGGTPSTPPKTDTEKAVESIEKAKDGDTLTLSLTGTTEVKEEVFEAIAGKDVEVVFDLGGGITWTVNGADIPADADLSAINLKVTVGTGILPSDVQKIPGGTSEVELRLSHDGAIGFKMILSVALDKSNAGSFANLYYYNPDSGELEFKSAVTIGADGKANFDFTHASDYLIVVAETTLAPEPEVPWQNPFGDVSAADWFYGDVRFAVEKGLFAGTSDTAFSPDDAMTRAMLVTVLWRMAGEPEATQAAGFADLTEGWYAAAVAWAAENGIVTGYDATRFGPEDNVTREQFAAILYRYIQQQGGGFEGAWAFPLDFADASDVSDWAYEALCYCTMHEIITGKPGNLLDPQGSANRAEAAAMLHRLLEN